MACSSGLPLQGAGPGPRASWSNRLGCGPRSRPTSGPSGCVSASSQPSARGVISMLTWLAASSAISPTACAAQVNTESSRTIDQLDTRLRVRSLRSRDARRTRTCPPTRASTSQPHDRPRRAPPVRTSSGRAWSDRARRRTRARRHVEAASDLHDYIGDSGIHGGVSFLRALFRALLAPLSTRRPRPSTRVRAHRGACSRNPRRSAATARPAPGVPVRSGTDACGLARSAAAGPRVPAPSRAWTRRPSDMRYGAAKSPMLASPRARLRSMARRVGSAKAWNTLSSWRLCSTIWLNLLRAKSTVNRMV